MIPHRTKWILLIALVVVAALLGSWLARDTMRSASGRSQDRPDPEPSRTFVQLDPPNPLRKSHSRKGSRGGLTLIDVLHAVPKERIIRFQDEEAYRRFLASLDGSDLRLLGQIDRLRAVRIGYDELDDLYDLLGDEGEDAGNYEVYTPPVPDRESAGVQAGAQGFGRETLRLLGITTDNSNWGEGVRIAVLDTGVAPTSAFPNGVRQIDLVDPQGATGEMNPHGTLVASLIAGSQTGVAPGAELLSVRIAGADGMSNSFLLAEGILAAVDAGAQILNISMGSDVDSGIVRDAIAFATESGVLVVAAAGNEGSARPFYPAANEGVLSVGAIDARGERLNFSNQGDSLDLTAPGFEVAAALPNDQYTLAFSGTSASSPIVAGALAAAMTEVGPLHPSVATQVLLDNLNAAGSPGDDPLYGSGTLDVGRIVNSKTPGIYDAAVASNWYESPEEGAATGTLYVTIENRGTATMSGTRVDVRVDNGVYQLNVPTLQPGQEHDLAIPVNAPIGTNSVSVNSTIVATSGNDRNSVNDSLAGTIWLREPPVEGGEIPSGAQPDGER